MVSIPNQPTLKENHPNIYKFLEAYNRELNHYFNKYCSNVNFLIVEARIVHDERDLCFNSDQREILYAIEDCFGEHALSQYKESAWGKSLCINMRDVPLNPPFENIMQKYEKHFLDRLTLIDISIEQKKQKHIGKLNLDSVKSIVLLLPERIKDLKKRKKQIYKTNFAYNVFYITGLPGDILNNIFGYLSVVNYEKSNKLRKAYENIRADINTAMLL